MSFCAEMITRFKSEDVNLLQQLGFCWQDGQCVEGMGSISPDSQVTDTTIEPQDYLKAFQNLSSLTGMPNILGACDIQKLFTGEGIARVIKNDPMMSQIMSGSALVYGETENPGKIRPRHFKRLVTYAKIALNIYFGNFASETKAGRMKALKINGKYDSELKAAVAKFQTEMGIPSCTDLQKGECMGKTIFGTLAVKVKYTKQELIAKLDEFKKSFDEKNSGKSYPVAYFHMGEFQRGEYADAQSVLFEALKWLGKISPNLRLVRIAHRENAEQALKEICMNYGTIPGNFGSSSLNIGGSVIADVIRELKAAK